MQMEAPRGGGGGKGGGYKESGLHVLYLLANSLLCLKSSGDRSGGSQNHERKTAARGAATQAERSDDDAAEVAPLTLLDERNPQQINADSPTAMPGLSQRALGGGGGGGSGNNRDSPFSPDELAAIRSLALSENAFPLLVHSMCPTIFGHELVKAGLLMGLFGGSSYRSRAQEDLTGNTTHSRAGGENVNASGQSSAEAGAGANSKEFKVRADIHVLIVGDPGLGKVRQRNSIVRIFQTIISKYVFTLHRAKCFGRRPPSPPAQCSFAETPPLPQDSQFLSPEILLAEAKVARDSFVCLAFLYGSRNCVFICCNYYFVCFRRWRVVH